MKETRENCSLKRTIKDISSNHHQLDDDEVELKKSTKEKMTKISGLDFLTYLFENEPRTYSNIMSFLEALYWKEMVNSKIQSIMNKIIYKN